MSRHDENERYPTRLRRIVIHSADVLPAEVSALLKKAGSHRRWDIKNEFLEDYRPLVDYCAEEYVNFVIDALIGGQQPTFDSWEDGADARSLGLHGRWEFFPAAHVKGPFLYCLRKRETQGLRLVQTLTNVAVARWRQRAQARYFHSPGITPLPVMIYLQSGPRGFWGDQQVFYWFRSMGMGPPAVVSALMALEVWMEEQIEAERDPEELFETILSQSDCVAVLGLCLGVALAYPRKCLKAALAIASSPAVWEMDIARFTADQQPSFDFDPSGRHKIIYELIAERDKRPQRSFEVRSLVPSYLFNKDKELRTRYREAVSHFTENLPFRTAEEQQNPCIAAALKERMENFQAQGDPANYHLQQQDEGSVIVFHPPRHIEERNATILKKINAQQRWASLDVWAQKTIDGARPEWLTLEAAVELARSFQKSEDFVARAKLDSGLDAVRLQAIAGVACAILVADFEWVRQQQFLSWARDIALAAARTPSDAETDRYSVLTSDPKVSAARALTILVEKEGADAEVRLQVIRLVGDLQLQVVKAVFEGLRNVWLSDNALCWNALGLALDLSVRHRRYTPEWTESSEFQRSGELIEAYEKRLEANVIPTLPRIQLRSGEALSWDTVARAIFEIPTRDVMGVSAERPQLIRLADDLTSWTIKENTPVPGSHHNDPAIHLHQWNYNYFGWLASLASSLPPDECEQHVLGPVRRSWPGVPAVTADLLSGYLRFRIGYIEPPAQRAQAEWREICNWVLATPDLPRWIDYEYLRREVFDALSGIIYVAHGASVFNEKWTHASLFLDITQNWVRLAGHNPDAYSSLLVMLNGPGWLFAPEPALAWLSEIVGRLRNTCELWKRHSNGERTAQLLHRIWDELSESPRFDSQARGRYSNLVDELVKAGVPLAGSLQEQIERRSSG